MKYCFFRNLALTLFGLNSFPLSAGSIVIGFVGGFVKQDDRAHAEVQFAQRLHNDYPSGVEVRVFQNRQGRQALEEVTRLLDSNRDGNLSTEEKLGAGISIYGHSWGASEAVTLARALGERGIPVLLTVQVDSVRKHGENDASIPANVAEAVNFYQRDGLLHGLAQIHAADPSRTRILGNFRLDYQAAPVGCEGYPWFARMFMKPHIEIESDPRVWRQVELLIRSKLPVLAPAAQGR